MLPESTFLQPKVWLPLFGSVVAAICCWTPFLYLKSFDFESLFYLAFLLLITLALGLIVILRRIFYKKWVKHYTWIAVVTFVCVSFAMSHSETHLRPWARWLIASSSYKSQVIAQPITDPSGIRFIEWDGWGWAGMDTNVYLIYDPSDTLKFGAHKVQGKKSVEITEKAQFIQRLEHNWYSATLFTSEYLYPED
jgi:hypothetical protein